MRPKSNTSKIYATEIEKWNSLAFFHPRNLFSHWDETNVQLYSINSKGKLPNNFVMWFLYHSHFMLLFPFKFKCFHDYGKWSICSKVFSEKSSGIFNSLYNNEMLVNLLHVALSSQETKTLQNVYCDNLSATVTWKITKQTTLLKN